MRLVRYYVLFKWNRQDSVRSVRPRIQPPNAHWLSIDTSAGFACSASVLMRLKSCTTAQIWSATQEWKNLWETGILPFHLLYNHHLVRKWIAQIEGARQIPGLDREHPERQIPGYMPHIPPSSFPTPRRPCLPCRSHIPATLRSSASSLVPLPMSIPGFFGPHHPRFRCHRDPCLSLSSEIFSTSL